MGGKRRGRQLDGSDQFIVCQVVVALRLIARQTVELGEGDLALAVAALDMHHSLQRCKGHAHIRRMSCHAGVARTEDRMAAVQAIARGAATARLTLVAGRAGVVEVITARALQQIAASAGHVSQLRRCACQDGLGQQWITLFHQRMPGQLRVADQRPDA